MPFILHWRCNIAKTLLFMELSQVFIVNLWVNWHLGCLWNCFQSPAFSVLSAVCARCFSAFCTCSELYYMFGILLLDYNTYQQVMQPSLMRGWTGIPGTSVQRRRNPPEGTTPRPLRHRCTWREHCEPASWWHVGSLAGCSQSPPSTRTLRLCAPRWLCTEPNCSDLDEKLNLVINDSM